MSRTPIDVQPKVYPRCSSCKTPFVLRRLTNLLDGKSGWYWQRDCKDRKHHRWIDKHPPESVDERTPRAKKKTPTRMERMS